jgi:hypothetical protein
MPCRRTAVDLAILCAVLLSLSVGNREWLFPSDGLDSWIYYGYFQHYDDPSFFVGQKKLARLPWILAGYAVNAIFPPIVAGIVLHAGFLLAGAIALYFLVRRLFNRNAAVLSAILFVAYTRFHGSGEWDYHNVATAPFYFLFFHALVAGTDERERPFTRFALFGALAAIAIHVNIIIVNLIPAMLIQLAFQLRRVGAHMKPPGWFWRAGLGALFGALALTAALGLVDVAVGREFFFYHALLERSVFLLEHKEAQADWWADWGSRWWAKDDTLWLLIALAVAVPFALLRDRRQKAATDFTSAGMATAIYIEFLVTLAIFAIWQALGQTSLQPEYMAYPAFLPAFLALAALIWRILPQQEAGVTLAAVVAGVLLVFFLKTGFTLPWHSYPALSEWRSFVLALIFLLGLVSAACVRLAANGLRRYGTATVVCYSCIALSFAVINGGGRAYSLFSACELNESQYALIAEVHRYLYPLAKRGKEVRVWWEPGETVRTLGCDTIMDHIVSPIVFSGFDGIMPIGEMDMASSANTIPEQYLRAAVPGSTIVAAFTNRLASAEKLRDRLRAHSPGWQIVEMREFRYDGLTYAIDLIEAPAASH